MLGKKKRVEEKLDTQVINLEAMKQAVSFEKQATKKKNIALLLLFLGLFMIIMGILYPIIVETIAGSPTEISSAENIQKEDDSIPTNVDQKKKDTLICTQMSEEIDDAKSIKDEYEFLENKLVKFTTTTTITAKTDVGREKVGQSMLTFSTLYGNVEAQGVSKNVNVSADNSMLTTVFAVDYSEFDLAEYNKLHADQPVFVTYQKNTKKSEIEKAMKAQGVTCE